MKSKIRSAVVLSILLLLSSLASAQPAPSAGSQLQGIVTWADDLSATSYTYCSMLGANGSPFGNPLSGPARIKTTGASTSVTAETAGQNPFADLAVGDIIYVRRPPNTVDSVVITVRTDADNVTVSATVNWSAGYSFTWRDKACGATNADGWFPVSNFLTVETQTEWVTKAATSLETQTECAMGLGLPVIIDTKSLTAAGNWFVVIGSGVYDRCRVGLKISTDTGAQVVNSYVNVKW